MNAYTDAPDLHTHWLLGSLQLLIWLLFHPSAWRNYVARLVPKLDPDFVLVALKPQHWRDRGLQRFLWLGYVVGPLGVGLIIACVFGIAGMPDKILTNVLAGISYAVTASIAIGLTVSVASGIVYGPIMGLLVGIGLPLLGGVAHGFIYSGAASIGGSVLLSLTDLKPSQSARKHVIGFVVALLTTGLLVGLIYNIVNGELLPMPSGGASLKQGADISIALGQGAMAVVLYGLVYGGIVRGQSHRWLQAIVIGLVIGLAGGIGYGVLITSQPDAVAYNVAAGVAGGLLFAGLFALPHLLGRYVAGIWAGVLVGTLISGISWIPLAPYIFPQVLPDQSALIIISLTTIVLGLTWAWWRLILLYPLVMGLNALLYYHDKHFPGQGPTFLRFHSAFWDEYQWLPLIGLDTHLIMVAEHTPAEGQAAINYLATRRQRRAAQTAQIELYARQMEQCRDIHEIEQAHQWLITGELDGPTNTILSSFKRYSQDVKAALTHDTVYLKHQALNDAGSGLNKLVSELNLTNQFYSRRFQPIAIQWYQGIVNHQADLLRMTDKNQEIDNPYIIGLPLTEKQQGMFVGRHDIIARIKQFLHEGHRTSLLLYGQRRMGKTSLLQNVGRFLPSTIVPLFVDEQGTAYSDNYGDHLYSVAKQIQKSAKAQRNLTLPPLPRETLAVSPFVTFNDWLDEIEEVMDEQDKDIVLLMLDEIEVLKQMTDKGRFDTEDLLNLFRNLIQHRSKFRVLLVGSHTLEEVQHWASYLINMEVIKINYLAPNEALRLIEQPIPNFSLRYDPEASQRVLKLTHGHPYLIQLLCHEIVICKNKQPPEQRHLVTLAEVEGAAIEALHVGNFFFANIESNQVGQTGLDVLRFLAAQGEGAVVSHETLVARNVAGLDQILAELQRRDLIERVEGGYQFQVELIRYWFEQKHEGGLKPL